MGCNCKSKEGFIKEVDDSSAFSKIVKLSAKLIGFSIGLLFLPIIMLAIVWFMFDTIVLNTEVDLTKIMDKFITKAKFFNNDDDEEDYDDDYVDIDTLTENDVIALNVEDITNKSK